MTQHCHDLTCRCANPYAVGTPQWVEYGLALAARYAATNSVRWSA